MHKKKYKKMLFWHQSYKQKGTLPHLLNIIYYIWIINTWQIKCIFFYIYKFFLLPSKMQCVNRNKISVTFLFLFLFLSHLYIFSHSFLKEKKRSSLFVTLSTIRWSQSSRSQYADTGSTSRYHLLENQTLVPPKHQVGAQPTELPRPPFSHLVKITKTTNQIIALYHSNSDTCNDTDIMFIVIIFVNVNNKKIHHLK